MKLQIETKTPVHIGNGLRYGLMEAYLSGKNIVRVNMDSLFSDNPETSKLYSAAVAEKNISIITSILQKGEIRYSTEIKGSTLKKLEDEIYETAKDSNGDVPYIPGSTIKGFLRTALIAKYLRDNNWEFVVDINGIRRKYNLWDAMKNGIWDFGVWRLLEDNREDTKKNSKRFKPDTLGKRFEDLVVFTGALKSGKKGLYFKYDAKYDIFKYLLVSDFYPRDKKYDFWIDTITVMTGEKMGASIFAEVINGNFNGDISLNPHLKRAVESKEHPLLKAKLGILGLAPDDLHNIQNAEDKMINHILSALKEHIESIKNYQRKQNTHFKNHDANLRIGFGTGFLYKTLWVYMADNLPQHVLNNILKAFEKHSANPNKYPKSTHVLSDDSELGWAMLER